MLPERVDIEPVHVPIQNFIRNPHRDQFFRRLLSLTVDVSEQGMLQNRAASGARPAVDQHGIMGLGDFIFAAEKGEIADVDGIDQDADEFFPSLAAIERRRNGHFPSFLAAAFEDGRKLRFLDGADLACFGRKVRQHRIELGTKEYFIDLLFYHRFLKALVAFDLKVGPFEPEHAGKMDFYLNLLNDKERGPGDKPSIGIILCAEKEDVEVEYALRTKANPIGVADYQLLSKLPGELKGKLPSAKQLANLLRAEMVEGN